MSVELQQEYFKNKDFQQNIKESIKNSIDDLGKALISSGIDCKTSGSTLLLCAQDQRTIIFANIGDSLAYRIQSIQEEMVGIRVNRSHKLSQKDERRRIQQRGGSIYRSRARAGRQRGQERVWSKGHVNYGLNMTRSLGDEQMRRFGVLNQAQFFQLTPDQNDICVVLGTDGYWDTANHHTMIQLLKQASKTQLGRCYAARVLLKGLKNIDDMAVAVMWLN